MDTPVMAVPRQGRSWTRSVREWALLVVLPLAALMFGAAGAARLLVSADPVAVVMQR